MLRKTALVLFVAFIVLFASAAVPPQESARAYDAVRAEAEKHYAEKSFARAHALYEEASKLKLSDEEKRWVAFRLADTTLRIDIASPSDDSTQRDAARAALVELTKVSDRGAAEANETIGDFHATHPRMRYLYQAQQYYLAALDWWAGSSDLPTARRRYLSIVWRLAPEAEGYSVAPREVLVNAVKIAETPQDRAHAQYLLAKQYLNDRSPASMERAFELLDQIVRLGKKTEWYDDALYTWAAYLNDYPKALGLYQRLLAEHTKSESEWYDDAQNAIAEITRETVDVSASNTFLPDSEQELLLGWRNTKAIELTVYSIDLTRDARWRDSTSWHNTISAEGKPVVRTWTHETQDRGEHRPGNASIRLQPHLPMGAYLVIARSGKAFARTIVLITDAHILLHAMNGRNHVLVSDVITGEPIAGAAVRMSLGDEKQSVITATTNKDGVAELASPSHGSMLITASAGARQAYHTTWTQAVPIEGTDRRWRVYAFTDRPAYRPDETVQWKILARVRDKGRWQTPAGETLSYEIYGPRGDKIISGNAKLNDFGSFWAELPLTQSMALGVHTIRFLTPNNAYAADAQLFRLEEYKLPEFAVSVSTPENTQYRLGDTIEATIDASYYFGGPVANAEVEAVVYQEPFVRYWYPWREYAWYWPDWQRPQSQSVMTRETLRTDVNGRAILRIDTPRDGSDTSYRIEARVVDSSRREVRGEGTVRVTRQRYSVMAMPEHWLHQPNERVNVKFRAVDANDKPIRTTGTIVVTKRSWKGRRYVDAEVLTTKLDTDAEGEVTLTFTPKTAGYYAVKWTSLDGDGKQARDKVTAETTVWVADRATTDIGYYQANGLDLIVDKETMRAGETANVMVVTPASGRWVMLTTSANSIIESRVVHLDGTVKLVQLPLDERYEPNFFITASSVFDKQLFTETERVVVPPVDHFLTVDVKSDREQYEPRQEGTLTITTRDADGKPVAAEVAVSVADEAVTAIQQDPAGDPREFFFNEQHQQRVQVSASLHSQQYVKLEKEPPPETVDESVEYDGGIVSGVEGGVPGGVVGGVVGGRAEAITVTANAPVMEPTLASPAPPPAPQMAREEKSASRQDLAAGADAAGIDVQVRSDFRSTAFWKPDVVTDASGTAKVKVSYPEALTTWRATARAATRGLAFGMGSSTSKTNLPLLVRLQSPRFFVVGDRAVVSGVINNNTDAAITVTPTLEAEGLTLNGTAAPVRVEARGEARVDWNVAAERPGTAKLRVTARGAKHADAMEKSFVVYEHGIDKLIARSGKMRGDEALIRLDLPRERRATQLVVQISPSLATTMLDALPYLIDYPYGCTEQTMSRFLPAAIVARTLEKLGLDPKERLPKKNLDAITAAGMARLYDMQHGDGGWGWWKDDTTDDFMTAYVVWGFSIARDAGLPVRTAAVNRAAAWLEGRLVEHRNERNEQAWMLHALSSWRNAKPTAAERVAYDNVWTNREQLSAYSRALLTLSAHRYGDKERTDILVRNLEDGVQYEDAANGEAESLATAHWGSSQTFWWRWYDGPVETTAFVLRALATIDPKHRLVEPTMNWLVKNRRGSQWSNTRDTAISLLALSDYLDKSGELRGDVTYELAVNGRVIATKNVTAADVLRAPSRFTIEPGLLKDAMQEIRIRRTRGDAPLYFSAEARFVSLEEPVKAAGNEIYVRRDYYRLKPRPTLLKGVLYDKIPLRDGEKVKSGERIEVVVTVDAKNDYSYLLFEDLKPAGFEAVALQSGQPLWATQAKTQRTTYVYQELRDRKVAMFVGQMAQGVWEIRYMLRAETPGSFHALPLIGQAMYVPDVRSNGDEVRVIVE
ncbi:MAG TPA: alpha-2-macroglobulin family protein [Thermoanaerobaculia bacterium]|jgi:uncharacterized protein YfaS (alpha-2-macroglobulin family)|nr:alpha-2-macroglobulin family protein [Thermoanaerobaculia bacterium]